MLFPAVFLAAAEREIVLGGGSSWKEYIFDNIEINSSSTKGNIIWLKDGEYRPDSATELLLHFNTADFRDAAGNFTVRHNRAEISEGIKKYGAGAALFNGEKDALILERDGPGLFPGKIYSGDFTIEFWVYGRNFSDGETIFQFDSYTNRGGNFIPQFFKCYFEERKIVWNIRNYFLPPDSESFDLKLSGTTRLVPGRWSHHLLRYQSGTGLMEYLIDGVPDAVAYVNTKGSETGEYYPFYSGDKGRIIIGDRFTGVLDELRIKTEWIENYTLSRYRNHAGLYVSEAIDLGHSKSSVLSIETDDAVPPGTEIRYYYFIDNFKKTPDPDSAEWRNFRPGFINASGGRFLRLKAELYAEGRGERSPVLSGIRVRYDQKAPPPPPAVVRAEAGNKSVRLRWQEVADPDIDGYHVYFGYSPGKYFGTTASGTASPIDAGKSNSIVIDNLENGRIYYFAVVSYYRTATGFGTAVINEGGRYSAEASARPLAVHGEFR